MAPAIAVIDTGVANTASILAILQRAGSSPFLTRDPEVVRTHALVVLPGVGAFGPAMEVLNGMSLAAPLKERVGKNMATLCVCLGFQLLAETSEESVGCQGLGVFPVQVVKFPSNVRVPQQGWNRVTADPRCRILKTGFAYFSNSFCLRSTPAGFVSCETQHGVAFVSAAERGRVVGTQFHPELSGTLGLGILKRWIACSSDPSFDLPTAPASALCRRVIPCLDVAGGRVVKGVKFQDLKDAGDPAEQAKLYEMQGADELVMLDISATPEARATTAETIHRLRANMSMPLTVGGGVRSVEDGARLLGAGADKIAVNTAAVTNPGLIAELAKSYGSQCTVLAIDAVGCGEGKWEVVVKSGKERTGKDVVEWAKEGVQLGAGEILLTSFDQDGTRAGYDCALLSAVCSAVSVPVIASGGANTAAHLIDALNAGADAVLAASIFHYKDTTVEDLKTELVNAGVRVRTSGYFGALEDQSHDSQNLQPFIPCIHVAQGRAVGVSHDGKEITDVCDAVRLLSVAGEVALQPDDDTHPTRAAVFSALRIASCRVCAVFSDVGTAYLDAGATMLVIRCPSIATWANIPRDRLCGVLEVARVDDQWVHLGVPVAAAIEKFAEVFGSIMINFVGLPIDYAALRRWASTKSCRLAVTSLVATPKDVGHCDRLSVQLHLGTSCLLGDGLAEGFISTLVSDRPDGLIPTVVADEGGRRSLGLVYSSATSVRAALQQRRGVYQSRSRGLWVKGETSGSHQDLLQIRVDCDRDTLCFIVRQHGAGFCHRGLGSCFGSAAGVAGLMRTLQERKIDAPEGSYTKKLYTDSHLLASKLVEEAIELADAVAREHVADEAADLLYFLLVACCKVGVEITDVERVLDNRSLRITRRTGNPKRSLVASRLDKMATTMRTWDRAAAPAPGFKTAAPAGMLRKVQPEDVPPLHRDPVDPAARAVAEGILTDIREQGEQALLSHAIRLGDIKEGERLVLYPQDLKAAYDALDPQLQGVLQRAAARIRNFAEAQRDSVAAECSIPIAGGHAGQSVAAVEVAGCYAPGGRYPLPSSVLMGVVTARVAGVRTVWVASPHPHQVVLAAAHVAGADGLLAAGGAQAIAAFTYGAGPVPVCDAIVGPGNKYVTAAKSLIAGAVSIDMLAGPSECLVVADGAADAAVVASDLLAQAEHDVAARAILVSTSAELIEKVDKELQAQLAALPTRETASVAIERNSFCVHVPTLEAAADISNRLAPEHLELHIADAATHTHLFHHYGALFVGQHAAEVLGDYGAGPNHTLPTGGTARSFGGLSVHTFRRMRTWMRVDDVQAARGVVEDSVALAVCEGLHGHARAAQRRLT